MALCLFLISIFGLMFYYLSFVSLSAGLGKTDKFSFKLLIFVAANQGFKSLQSV